MSTEQKVTYYVRFSGTDGALAKMNSLQSARNYTRQVRSRHPQARVEIERVTVVTKRIVLDE